MSWSNLKAGISAVVKENNNQEITGTNLQNVLITMVNSLGANATCGGIAHPNTSPGTPDGPVFWIASGPGVYVNFGNTEIDNTGIFTWNGTSWSFEELDFMKNSGAAGELKVVNNLTEGGEESALSAEMGKLLYNNFITLFNALGEGAFWSGRPTLNWNAAYAYITDGLVFHLDSMNMGGTSGHWIDSVGGIDFALTDCDTSGKGVKFNGRTSIGKSSASWQYKVSECTIEVCIKIGSRTDWCMVLISNTQGSICFAYSTANSYYINGAGSFPSSAKPMRSDTIQSVSMSKGNCMANGSTIPANEDYYCTLSNALSIGGRDGNEMFDGTIYDIRVYNRVLSDAERVNNLKVDKYRFNF